jgi:hypothetical protein
MAGTSLATTKRPCVPSGAAAHLDAVHVLFVPTFFVVVQRFENWLAERKGKKAGVAVSQAPGATH